MSNYTLSFDPSSGDERYSPRSLKQLGAKVCGSNIKSLLFDETKGENGSELHLKTGMELPQEVLKAILSESDHCSPHYLPMILELCENVLRKKVVLKDIDLTNCKSLTDAQFERVMRVKPTTLRLHNCGLLTGRALQLINQFGENLKCLNFGNSAFEIINGYMNTLLSFRPNNLDLSKGLLNTPNLTRLELFNMDGESLQKKCESLHASETNADFLEWLTRLFISKLEHLDLSCTMVVQNPEFLIKAKDTLSFLCLRFAVPKGGLRDPEKWEVLKNLTKLRFLDVADCNIPDMNPSILKMTIDNLRVLEYLYLTRNQGIRVSEVDNMPGRFRIDALASREETPLKFICLYAARSTVNCKVVPARVVIRNLDHHFYNLVKIIMAYNDKEIPRQFIDSLQLISNQRLLGNEFSWNTNTRSFNWLLNLMEANLLKFQCRHPIYKLSRFFRQVLKEPFQFTTSQLHRLFECLINFLRLEWNTSEELVRLLNIINECLGIIDVSITQFRILLPALVRSIRSSAKLFGDGSTIEKTKSALYIRRIENYVREEFTGNIAKEIQSETLSQEIMALDDEVNRMDMPPMQALVVLRVLRSKFMQ